MTTEHRLLTNKKFWRRAACLAVVAWIGLTLLLVVAEVSKYFRFVHRGEISGASVFACIGVTVLLIFGFGIPWMGRALRKGRAATNKSLWFRAACLAGAAWVWVTEIIVAAEGSSDFSWMQRYGGDLGEAAGFAIVGITVIFIMGFTIPWVGRALGTASPPREKAVLKSPAVQFLLGIGLVAALVAAAAAMPPFSPFQRILLVTAAGSFIGLLIGLVTWTIRRAANRRVQAERSKDISGKWPQK